jgi:hypothetical protein
VAEGDTRATFRAVLAKQLQEERGQSQEPERLTVQQYELLAALYYESHKFEEHENGDAEQKLLDRILEERFPGRKRVEGVYISVRDTHPVLWSPKALLGRSPTKTESANFSRSLKKLLERHLVIRKDRFVTVTEAGREALSSYEAKNFDSDTHITFLLRQDEMQDTFMLVGRVAALAKKYGVTDLITDKPGTLPDLIMAIIESLPKAKLF